MLITLLPDPWLGAAQEEQKLLGENAVEDPGRQWLGLSVHDAPTAGDSPGAFSQPPHLLTHWATLGNALKFSEPQPQPL